MKTTAEILKGIEIFSSLEIDELNIFAGHMKRITATKGDVLFREGDAGTKMYIVLEGKAGVTVKLPDGGDLEIAEIGQGSFVGEMSIFEPVPRSATCVMKEDSVLLSLHGDDFFSLLDKNPGIAIRVMHRMLTIISLRLKNTGAFLSDMVQWGETARKRAITDEFTGLYNRRFLDEVIEDRFKEAASNGRELSLVMVDLDHFGVLNREYGQETGDNIIKSAAGVFLKVYRPEHILSRYGGDEFTFVLTDTGPDAALIYCEEVVKELRAMGHLKQKQGSIRQTTASIGIAAYPQHADDLKELMERADKALYKAKEQGRDRAVVFEPGSSKNEQSSH
jgi:diguanylate cyclase (GGDEF)-like protein